MTRDEKLKTIVRDIKEYSYSPNSIYLFPLNDYVALLRTYCSYDSRNAEFNEYLKNELLKNLDWFVKICEDGGKNKPEKDIEWDIKRIRKGAIKWESHFRLACERYAVDALKEEVF